MSRFVSTLLFAIAAFGMLAFASPLVAEAKDDSLAKRTGHDQLTAVLALLVKLKADIKLVLDVCGALSNVPAHGIG